VGLSAGIRDEFFGFVGLIQFPGKNVGDQLHEVDVAFLATTTDVADFA